jgi:hypothetical protein
MMKRMTTLRRAAAAAVIELLVFAASVQTVFAQDSNQGLQNPLSPQFSTIPGFISGALKVMVEVALPIITVAIVYAGFKFVAARGNPGKLSEARTNFVFVILGALLILGAWIIATLIGGTVTQLVNG